ncbi:MATN2 [Branchiostoma lanceolatum]|uniref:MATN2 protein n=1 Tax=Branchiostoma lanceolatum TaxID=7740 RepID=A0A8J9W6W7_BRALA|nr:MATN2 [Branchiostoma lanceolatum]
MCPFPWIIMIVSLFALCYKGVVAVAVVGPTRTPHRGLVPGHPVDLTLQEEARGTPVVLACMAKIHDSKVFDSHRLLSPMLRRMARAATEDGQEEATYRPEYHGGIWQIDYSDFRETLDTRTYPHLRPVWDNIMAQFGIHRLGIRWKDLRKPLYSSLVAGLKILTVPDEIPPSIPAQAAFWKNYCNNALDKSPNDYVTVVDEVSGCQAAGLDLVFVLDGSASVGKNNFQLSKDFVNTVIQSFTIGLDLTRVGVIQYSFSVNLEIELKDHPSAAPLVQAVEDIEYDEGLFTHTGEALQYITTHSFTVENGAREVRNGVPKVSILLTDGESGDYHDVTVWSQRARESNITMFPVGVTNDVDQEELETMAGHAGKVFRVRRFRDLEKIVTDMEESLCRAVAAVPVGTPVTTDLDKDAVRHLSFIVPEAGMTFKLTLSRGQVAMYGSSVVTTPNEAVHNFNLTSGELFFRQAPVSSQDVGTTVYVSVYGLSDHSTFTLHTTEGDTTTTPPSQQQAAAHSSTTSVYKLDPKGVTLFWCLFVYLTSTMSAYLM